MPLNSFASFPICSRACSSISRASLALVCLGALLPFVSLTADTRPLPEADRVMETETRWAISTLNSRHYLKDSITDLNGDDMVKAYMRSLDGNRMFFLDEDVEDFVFRFSEPMENFLDRGNLYPAFQIFAQYRTRVEARTEWIRERLQGDFDFNTDQTFTPDRREADWLTDAAAADDLWTRRLKFELLNEIISLSQVSEDQPTARTLTDDDLIHFDEAMERLRERSNVSQASDGIEFPLSDDDDIVVDNGPGSELEMPELDSEQPEAAGSSGESNDEFALDEAALRRLATDQAFLDEKLSEARERVLRRHERSLRFAREKESAELQEAFVNSMSQLFDPHSTFFSADTLEEFNTSVQNSFVGIGAVLFDDDGYCTIKELIPGGPAEASRQLGPEDQILAVAEGEEGEFVDVIDMRLRHIVNMIKGPEETIVRLLIRPGEATDPSARREVRLVRDEIRLTANLASARLIQVPNPADSAELVSLGVIEVPSFYGSIGTDAESSTTSEDVRELIAKLEDRGVEGIILDLRTNGGGLLTEAIRLAGLFVPGGPIVQVRNGAGRVDTLSDTSRGIAWSGPLVVLTSRFSASASEIVAGALRDHQRALIVGDSSTHGKGTVQQVFQTGNRPSILGAPRARPVAAKVTINQFFLPGGDSTQLRGVPSDIVLPSANEFLPIGESNWPNPIPWKAIDPLKWEHRYAADAPPPVVSEELIGRLKEGFLARADKLPEFQFLQEQIDWRQQRREERNLSLNLAERIEKRIQDEALRLHFKESFERLAEDNYAESKIILQLTQQMEDRSREARAASDSVNGEVISDEADGPTFDIHLREALRILVDWNRLLESGDAPRSQVVALRRPAASSAVETGRP